MPLQARLYDWLQETADQIRTIGAPPAAAARLLVVSERLPACRMKRMNTGLRDIMLEDAHPAWLASPFPWIDPKQNQLPMGLLNVTRREIQVCFFGYVQTEVGILNLRQA